MRCFVVFTFFFCTWETNLGDICLFNEIRSRWNFNRLTSSIEDSCLLSVLISKPFCTMSKSKELWTGVKAFWILDLYTSILFLKVKMANLFNIVSVFSQTIDAKTKSDYIYIWNFDSLMQKIIKWHLFVLVNGYR